MIPIKHKFSALLFLIGSVFCLQAYAQQPSTNENNPALNQIITPDLERRVITEDQIDSEDWEFGIYTGVFNFEDFGSNTVTGLRLAYHMSPSFVIEANYGITEAKESQIEALLPNLTFLTSEQREYTYYNFSLVYNIPGELFIGKNTAYNVGFYLLFGGGNTTFVENDYFTYTLGGGLRFYLTDSLAIHATVKDHIFDAEDIFVSKTRNNIESTIGLSMYF